MTIQTIKQNTKKGFEAFVTRIKRVARRTALTCVLATTVSIGAVAYAGYVVVPHAHNIYSAAKLIDGEARGESVRGQRAVFGSILTRMTDKRFPSTMHGVVYQPYSNTDKVLQYNAMGDSIHENLSTDVGQMILLRTAWWYTLDQFGLFYAPSEARGAHSYCTLEACVRQKGYFGTLKRIGQIGSHVFYGNCNDEEAVTMTAGITAAPTTSIRPAHRPTREDLHVTQSSRAPVVSIRPARRTESVVLAEQVEQKILRAVLMLRSK